MRRKLAAGNWKMNGTNASLTELQALIAAHPTPSVEILICPPATLIVQAAGLSADSPLMIGAQDCHTAASGAHTGDIAAPMLADAGAVAVILGHSERRQHHSEQSALVASKAAAAHAAHLTAVICL
ncbi:MAG: triose-phosphate isomerase, partial [Roseovarius sp.]